MLGRLRILSLRPPRPVPTFQLRLGWSVRQLSLTAVRLADKDVDAKLEEDGEDAIKDKNAEDSAGDERYEQWLVKSGAAFQDHSKACNWLGGDRPFPLNQTFQPSPPISAKLRGLIYDEFMHDPALNTVRALSERHGLSIKRVDAILRLAGLEQQLIKGKPLQTGFQAGMEKILGVQVKHTHYISSDLSEDTIRADHQKDDAARHRYQRMYWEPISEGRRPELPKALEFAKQFSQEQEQATERRKSDGRLLGRHNDAGPRVRSHIVERPGRPTFEFVDVGGKLLDVKDRVRRMKESQRRQRLKVKRQLRRPSGSESSTVITR